MALVNKIDSNVTGLRYSVEPSAIGVAGVSPSWKPLDPNSYSDFGGSFTKVARTPINNKRSRYKGVLTDLESAGGFNIDMTQTNVQGLYEGFLFDQFEEKGLEAVTAVSATVYTVGTNVDFAPRDVIWATGFNVPGNNGLKQITSLPDGVTIATTGLAIEASPPGKAQIVRVGHQFLSGDLTVDVSGALPELKTTTKNLTTLGLVPGEMIYIGGDVAIDTFANSANTGWCRVRSVSTNSIVLDKTSATMVTDAGTGKTVRIFFGRVLRNREGTEIVRTTYHLERELGAPNDSSPTALQAEYIEGAVPNEMTMAIDTAGKIMVDMGFKGIGYSTNDSGTGLKAGNRPALETGKAFNTSTHVTRIRMGLCSSVDAYVDALFAYVTELRLTINNNVSLNKAVGTLGAFDVTSGTFEVGGNVTAYFQNVEALVALQNNSDVTLDVCVVKDNAGFAFDLPLLSLDDGRLNVELNQPVTIPLGVMAADGADVDPNLNHTLMMCFFDYLPDAASA